MVTIPDSELGKHLEKVPEWKIDETKTALARTFIFGDFQDAIVFVNKVARIAEEMNHHPDLFVHGYRNVTVSLSTHSQGALTEKDFAQAQRIDSLL